MSPASRIAGTDVAFTGGSLSPAQAGELLKQLDTANLSEVDAAILVASMSQKPPTRAQRRRDVSRFSAVSFLFCVAVHSIDQSDYIFLYPDISKLIFVTRRIIYSICFPHLNSLFEIVNCSSG